MSTAAEQNVALTGSHLPSVREVVYSAEQQLVELLGQRDEITRRIGTVKKMLVGMASLFGESILDDDLLIALDRGTSSRGKGFTPACRQVLMESHTPLQVRQACGELQQRFPQLAVRHKDLAASVTTVFHRLVKYGQARRLIDNRGVRVWEWATDPDLKMPNTAFTRPAAPEAQPRL